MIGVNISDVPIHVQELVQSQGLQSFMCQYVQVTPSYSTFILLNVFFSVFMYLNYITDFATKLNNFLDKRFNAGMSVLSTEIINAFAMILLMVTNVLMFYYQFLL